MPPPKKQSKKKKSKKRKSKQRPAQYVYPAVARPLNTATPTPYLTRFNTTSHIIYNARSAGLPLNLGALQAEQDLRRNIIAASQDGNPFAQAQLPQMMQQYDDVVSNILQRGPAPQQPQAPPQAPGQQPIGEHTQNFLRENEDYAPSESSRGSSFLGQFGRGLGVGIGSNLSSIRSGTNSYSSIDSSSLFDSTFDPDSSSLSSYETGSTSVGSVRRSEIGSLMFGDDSSSLFDSTFDPDSSSLSSYETGSTSVGSVRSDLYGPVQEVDYPDMDEYDLNRFRSQKPQEPEQRRDFNDRVQYEVDQRKLPQNLRTDPRFMSADTENTENTQFDPPAVEAPAVDVPDRQLSNRELSQLSTRELMLELMRAEGKVQDSIAEVEAPAIDGKSDTTIVAGDIVPASNPVKPQSAPSDPFKLSYGKPQSQATPDPFKLSFDELTISGGLPSLYHSAGMAGFSGASTYANQARQAAAQRQLDYERSLALPPPDPTLALPAPSERLALTMPGYGMESQDDPTTVPLMGDAPLDSGPTYDFKDNDWMWETRYGQGDTLDYGDPLETTPFMSGTNQSDEVRIGLMDDWN